MKLKVNPLPSLLSCISRSGFLARKQFNKIDETLDTKVKTLTLSELSNSQEPNGSWEGSTYLTAWNVEILFDLGLIGSNYRRGVNFILSQQNNKNTYSENFFYTNTEKRRLFGGKTFRVNGYNVSAFVLYVLQKINVINSKVLGALERLAKFMENGFYCCSVCTNLSLRALSFRKEYEAIIEKGLTQLEKLQYKGRWRVRFYSTSYEDTFFVLHTLSFFDKYDIAIRMAHNSLPVIIKMQKRDGMWGRQFRDEKTYIVVTLLKKMGLLEDLLPE